MNTVEPIRDKRDIAAIKKYLREKDEKYYIMFITGINLGMRINEVLKLTVGDVKDKTGFTIRQSKTGKEFHAKFNKLLIREYKEYCKDRAPDEALIPSPDNEYRSVSRQRAYVVLREAAEHYRLQYSVGTHTMRKTCGYHFYRETHDIVTLQRWFNHRSADVTLRYIGVTRDTITNAMENFEL